MKRYPLELALRVGGVVLASVIPALVIACATNAPPAPTAEPTLVAAAQPTRATQAESTPTRHPRQHSGEHIEGLGEPVDAPHFVDSFPNHAQTLTQSPARVGINFDVVLAPDSTLTVEHDGMLVQSSAVEFDARKIYMSAALPPDLGDGLYLVKYRACFAGAGCADGQIGFRVDAARVKNFVDLTGQPEVTIHLENIKYTPSEFIVSPGTTVTWINGDPFEHFVNSDPHPTHNAFPDLNSLDIPPGKTFSFTFRKPGEYAFHCSAHVPQNMYGRVIVRETKQVNAAPPTAATTVIANTDETITPALSAPPTVTPTSAAARPPTRVPPTVESTIMPLPANQNVGAATLPTQKFAAHFVSSVPEHAGLLTAVPQKIQIHFNFTLARNSSITVRKDGEKLTLGGMEFAENRLAMAVNVPAEAGAGRYHVLYRACWPDKSCHDGEFAFVVRTP